MATAERFEDLIAWQKARLLSKEIYAVTRRTIFNQDVDLRRQIRRAAVSAMSNIAEGFDRHGPGEFYQFLGWARGSASEVRSQLYVALDNGLLSVSDFDRLHAQASECSRVIGGLQAYIKTCKPRKPAPRAKTTNYEPRTTN